ncbi:hypothetical protein QR680_009152 [Steinernema hermaphroditum]|uniref:Uncharacterized protein n=1 Tax=Steinernema hermaphroditum TaxID=289476 RepID=A0AA39M9D4_9BILA|nr:hypothetical protein QR680_009152 [Steinernema hermaphroditum]
MIDVDSVLCDHTATQQGCVQHSYLVAVPTATLFLLAPLLIHHLRRSKNGVLSANSPNSFRIVLCTVQCVVVASLFVFGLFEHLSGREQSRLELLYPLPLGTALLLALGLLVACHRSGVLTSGVLFVFWLLLAVCGVPEFRKVLEVVGQDILSHPRLFLFGVHYIICCVQLSLSCFADKLHDRAHSEKESPELHSSFLNQITFQWFDQLTWKGFRRPLSTDDLWNLSESDRSASTVAAFDVHWKEAVRNAEREAKARRNAAGSAEEQLLPEDAFIEQPTQPQWIGVGIAVAMFLANLV